MNNIELHIDQLILHGFSRRDAFYIKQSLQQELSRMIQKDGLPTHFQNEAHTRRMDAGEFRIQASAKPEVIGRQIAGQVYGGGEKG